jgi:xylulokinase
LGKVSFADVPGLVQFKHAYQPNSQNRALYDERFGVFKQIYKQMKDIYKRLNG